MATLHARPTISPTLVKVEHLTHRYGKAGSGALLVLDDVDLTLRENEIVGLLGRSGSGKSTLLRSIAGLIRADDGSIDFVADQSGVAPTVSMVFQTFALFPWLTVLQNVELGLEAQRVPAEERRTRALAAIDLIGLDGFENAYPKELSGGMRQRVGLARAIVVNPSLLLMDEPFSALDVLPAETLRTDLLDLWSEGRMPIKSILIVTHNIEEAVLMCDRILVFSFNPGRVAAEIKVDLPQPRDRLDPPFRALVDDIYARMTARTPPEPHLDGVFPGTGIQMVLPRVSTNSLAGLIEEVDASPFHGRAAMADLADQLQLEIDDLFPMAETLQLLRFADLRGAEIVLTSAARRYAQADVDTRKGMFAHALLAHVPLAQHIKRIPVKAGLYNLNSEFDTTQSGGFFLLSSHGIGPDFSQSGRGGPSIFPVTSLAVRAEAKLETHWLARVAILDGVPGDPARPAATAIKLSARDGALSLGRSIICAAGRRQQLARGAIPRVSTRSPPSVLQPRDAATRGPISSPNTA